MSMFLFTKIKNFNSIYGIEIWDCLKIIQILFPRIRRPGQVRTRAAESLDERGRYVVCQAERRFGAQGADYLSW